MIDDGIRPLQKQVFPLREQVDKRIESGRPLHLHGRLAGNQVFPEIRRQDKGRKIGRSWTEKRRLHQQETVLPFFNPEQLADKFPVSVDIIRKEDRFPVPDGRDIGIRSRSGRRDDRKLRLVIFYFVFVRTFNSPPKDLPFVFRQDIFRQRNAPRSRKPGQEIGDCPVPGIIDAVLQRDGDAERSVTPGVLQNQGNACGSPGLPADQRTDGPGFLLFRIAEDILPEFGNTDPAFDPAGRQGIEDGEDFPFR